MRACKADHTKTQRKKSDGPQNGIRKQRPDQFILFPVRIHYHRRNKLGTKRTEHDSENKRDHSHKKRLRKKHTGDRSLFHSKYSLYRKFFRAALQHITADKPDQKQ